MLTLRRFLFGFLLFSFILPSGTLLLPQPASGAAFGLVPCALKENNPATEWDERAPCTLCHFLIGMNFIVKLLRNIMTACAIAVIVAMAIIYITSAGDEGRMTFAKTGIKYSLIGFIVILLAWVMVNFIFTLPIFANNGLVRTGWDTFTCSTTSQVSWATTTPASGIGNATGSAGSGQPGREGLPGQTPPPPGGGGDPGGGGTPPPSFGCGIKHYDCINGDPDQKMELGDSWIWICRGTGTHFGETKNCTEKKTGCGDGIVQNPNSAGQSEACDKGSQNGDCPAECSTSCTVNTCLPPPPPNDGNCHTGTYSWSVGGNSCSASYGDYPNNALTAITDSTPPTIGSIGLRCQGGSFVPDSLMGEPTCSVAAGGAACGGVQLDNAGNPIAAAFCSQGYHGPLNCSANNGVFSCTWTCFSLTGDVPPVDCSGSAVIPGGPNG